MEELQNNLKKLIELMGFEDFSLNCDAEGNRFSLFVNEGEGFKKMLPLFVTNLDHLVKLMAKKKEGEPVVFIDINNYRKEREGIILEIARGAARKAVATKEEITLPTMNAYERRLIHVELASRPDIKTESVGEGKNRYVVVKPIL